MTKRKQPYNNTFSDWFWLIVAALLIAACSSCATYKKDCRGVRHEKHKNGFYI